MWVQIHALLIVHVCIPFHIYSEVLNVQITTENWTTYKQFLKLINHTDFHIHQWTSLTQIRVTQKMNFKVRMVNANFHNIWYRLIFPLILLKLLLITCYCLWWNKLCVGVARSMVRNFFPLGFNWNCDPKKKVTSSLLIFLELKNFL